MLIAADLADPWTVLLAIGLVVTFMSTVALIVGLSPARRNGSAPSAVPSPPTALGLGSASTVRDRAAARAKVAAAASSPPAPPRHHMLTDVHVVEPAGQVDRGADDHAEPLVSDEEARAIVDHFAEHDPTRIAEVISQWIRSDQQNGHGVAW